ncbi:MAG: gamma-glutamyl-gamma-aminobutyrate hydrolase family protein [Bacteroidetes bacterium]|nr:gamma-glutamyl-gamma-aminobutyrate hydrolase family protein [Bacteroidota bacterium]
MKIGITDCKNNEKQELYSRWLKSVDAETECIVLSPWNEDDAETCSGILFTGGADIDPELSQAKPATLVKKIDRERDDFEIRLLKKNLNRNIPILGICRGMQLVNVGLGGSLFADLEYEQFKKHDSEKDEPENIHPISIVEQSALHAIVQRNGGSVNSYHHQAVKMAAPEFIASSFSEDNVIESLEWKEKAGKPFLLLVQWHPERMENNPLSKNIAEKFLDASAKK